MCGSLSRNQSGRVARLKLDGLVPDEVSGQDLRVAVGRTLGWQHIKSAMFDLRRQDGTLSVHRARLGPRRRPVRDRLGQPCRPWRERRVDSRPLFSRRDDHSRGTRLAPNPPRLEPAPPAVVSREPAPPAVVSREPSDLLLSLPDGDEGERKAIAQLTARARDDMARTLGVTPPARVAVRFHPTTDDYERATSQPWFTSGAVVSAECTCCRSPCCASGACSSGRSATSWCT